jgi:hypothetical protein
MSALDAHAHTRYRRRITAVYLKSWLQNSRRLHGITSTVIFDRLLPQLETIPSRKVPTTLDALPLCFAVGMDIVSAYIFGLEVADNFVQDQAKRNRWLEMYASTCSPMTRFCAQEMPVLWKILSRFVFAYTATERASAELNNWCLELCKQTAEVMQRPNHTQSATESFPEVYAHLTASIKENSNSKLEVASELLDHLMATSEVFSITLAKAFTSWLEGLLSRQNCDRNSEVYRIVSTLGSGFCRQRRRFRDCRFE